VFASGSKRLSFVLLGADSLLIECAEIVRARGHELRAVLSTSEPIRRWAAEHEVPCLVPDADPPPALAGRPFDCLVSVTNLVYRPGQIRLGPWSLMVNYHDGPIPRYGGFNATAWALINRERTHGVTWHIWGEAFYHGDILVQRTFDVAQDETSLTLNAKCYEAAVDSFRELIDGLAEGRLAGRSQRHDPQTFCTRWARPVAACTIRWDRPAEELEALVRALDFGPYPNPLGVPKLRLGRRVVAVRRAIARPASSGAPVVPGTVTTVCADALRVAAGAGELEISRLTTLGGEPLSIDRVAVEHGLEPGTVLPALSPALVERLTTLTSRTVREEAFWRERLSTLAWLAPPHVPESGTEARDGARGGVIVVPAALDTPERVIAAAAVLLARSTGRWRFDLGFSDPELRAMVQDVEEWFTPHLPLGVELERDGSFTAAANGVARAVDALRRHRTYPRDLASRFPELRLARGPAPIVVEIVEDPEAAVLPDGAALALFVMSDARGCRWVAAPGHEHAVEPLTGRLAALLEGIALDPAQPLARLPLLSAEERRRVLVDWNDTRVEPDWAPCVHTQIEAQMRRTPDALAVITATQRLTYRELDARSGRLAAYLQSLGVGPEQLVAIHLDRSADLVIAILAVLRAGGAYLPLDPSHPADRIAFMLADAGPVVVLTQEHLAGRLPPHHARVVSLEQAAGAIGRAGPHPAERETREDHLAYVIYTSGSTGRPKGVMVEHRNVTNLFAGMDARVGAPRATGGAWLAVTSLSFDISALELLWTLARGYTVVLHEGEIVPRERPPVGGAPARPLSFSLFYFASDEAERATDKYHLLLEGARFADAQGFAAVWTPERHLHRFGGLYPNPAVTGAAIAAITRRVGIRAGSVVLPLHMPIRVAEEWAVVDNLSGGRVGIAVASGWQPNDFVLRPESFAENRAVMRRDLEVLRRLWRGEAVPFPNGAGDVVEVRTWPRPLQPELPLWITSAGNPETFVLAGTLGANVLTNLLGQTIEELAAKLAAYRAAWRASGHPGEGGTVTLMLHTFLGPSDRAVREHVRVPLVAYLGSSVGLMKQYASTYPVFHNRVTGVFDRAPEASNLSPEELEAVLAHAFERYYETSGLFGTPERGEAMVRRLAAIGVSEIASLIDFGVEADVVLRHLEYLDALRERLSPGDRVGRPHPGSSIPELIVRFGVTHLQCTPSLAAMLAESAEGRDALGTLEVLLVGGEALPAPLARELRRLVGGRVLNMYGPTETTIWSTTYEVEAVRDPVPIGRPIVNTECYVLDDALEPVPVGVPGELYIGGLGVARGYRHRPELTAERFVPHPLRPAGGERVYRTGDRVRWRADGVLEFLGRTDHQVKIRGHRVEPAEIERVLAEHPAVREVVVTAHRARDGAGETVLVAYVVRRRRGGASADASVATARVEQWRAVYDDAYAHAAPADDPALITAGWTSSYTGAPIPAAEMREWVEGTVQRILRHEPQRVLEIGCGTGMLLHRIAPRCTRYDAIDLSAEALRLIERSLRAMAPRPPVRLMHRAAHELDDLEAQSYDAVVLSSVVQYFPHVEYLLRVLEQAARLVAPGGVIIVADVRSLPLLEAFHLSVEVARADPGDRAAELWARVRRRVDEERELVLHPRLFERLGGRIPTLTAVCIEPRRGRRPNEMTCFRYDVTLRVGGDPVTGPAPAVRTLDWEGDRLDLNTLSHLLAAERADAVAVTGIPNARVRRFEAAADRLRRGDFPERLDALMQAAREAEARAVDPEALWALAAELPYEVHLRPALQAPDGLEARFVRRGSPVSAGPVAFAAPRTPPTPPTPPTPLALDASDAIDWSLYANDPLGWRSTDELPRALRTLARARLPEVMVPSHVVLLDALPRTPNGKIDRAALPEPTAQPAGESARELPVDALERAIARVWQDVLGVPSVGATDDFFALGGHSLLAVRAHRRLREELQCEITVADIFRHPTVRELARAIRTAGAQPAAPGPAIPRISRDAYRIS
jgi:natural product biosynthesis luciferase-like monooxygenase protein